MRPSADAGDTDGFDTFARALQSTFPAGNDASLALALLRLLSEGRPVTPAVLAQAANRTAGEVVGRLSSWPYVERDEAGQVVAFSGLTLRPTAYGFRVGTRRLHTWVPMGDAVPARPVAPDRGRPLPLPSHWLRRRARRRPGGVTSARPADLHVSFPSLAATDTDDITGSFCCHVFFLAGADAARTSREPGSSTVMEVSR